MRNHFDVLVFSFYPPAYIAGGPVRSIEAIIDYTRNDINYLVYSQDKFNSYSDKINYEYDLNNPKILTYEHLSFIGVFKLIRKYRFNYIYLNSLFSFKQVLYSVIFSWIFGVKIVISIRGQIEDGAMSNSSNKKKIYLFIFRMIFKNSISKFHSTCISETSNISKKLRVSSDNIIQISNLRKIKTSYINSFSSKTSDGYFNVIFYSRIVPKKNLLQLLNLLYHSNLKSVRLDIYGNIEDISYWQKCLNVIQDNEDNINILVTYKGIIENVYLYEVLSQYNVFIFPTLSENYGHVIIEALMSGIPILVNNTTPFSNDILKFNIGHVIDFNDSFAFYTAMTSCMNMSDDDYVLIKKRILNYLQDLEDKNILISRNYINLFKP
jgi:glycosyltransferase involved in cell wall biosynthesis